MSNTGAGKSADERAEMADALRSVAHLLETTAVHVATQAGSHPGSIRQAAEDALSQLSELGEPLGGTESLRAAGATLGKLASPGSHSVGEVAADAQALLSQAKLVRADAETIEETGRGEGGPKRSRAGARKTTVEVVKPLSELEIPRVMSPDDPASLAVLRSVVGALESYRHNLTIKARLAETPPGSGSSKVEERRRDNLRRVKSSVRGLGRLSEVVNAMQRGQLRGESQWNLALGHLKILQGQWFGSTPAARLNASPFSSHSHEAFKSAVLQIETSLKGPSADRGLSRNAPDSGLI